MQHGEDGVGRRKSGPIASKSDLHVFGIVGDWKATALKAEVRVETVTVCAGLIP